MKRTRFILLALVAAMVLMGAGYAAWTQSFTIGSTVSTGELFVQVSEGTSSIDAYDNASGSWNAVTDDDYLDNIVSTVDGDTSGGNTTLSSITFDIGDMYPGTKATNTIDFQNLGTVDVETLLDSQSITNNNDLWDSLVIKVNGVDVMSAGTAGTKIENLAEAIRAAVGDLEAGGDAKTVTITQELPIGSGNTTENLDTTWTVKLSFEQYNNQ